MIRGRALEQIMQKEVTRKEFLRYAAVMVVSLFGAKSVASWFLDGNSETKKLLNKHAGRGFGGGRFGV